MGNLDLSQFSSQQLQALAQGDYSSLSNQQLQMLSQWHDQQQQAQAPQQAQQQFSQQHPVQSAIAPVAGAAMAGAGMAAAVPGAAFNLAKEHPVAAGALGYAFKEPIEKALNSYIRDPAMRAAQSVKDIALQGVRGGTQAVQQAATKLGSISPESMGLGSMADAAAAIAPYARMATGAGLMAYSPGLNSGENQQIAQIHAQQNAMMPQQPQPINPGMQQ